MDTDYLSQLQRGDKQILAHLAQIQPQQIGITIIIGLWTKENLICVIFTQIKVPL
jgi:hypothetical protein